MGLQVTAYAKINLTLDVLYKRADGYHEVKTILQTIDLADRLSFRTGGSGVEILTNHPQLPTGPENLIYQAIQLIAREFGIQADLEVDVEKNIPLAAGLAGGSSDAAATLVAVNRLWDLNLTTEELSQRAARLGADIPFCLFGGTRLATGIGTELEELSGVPQLDLVVVNPPFQVATDQIYNRFSETDKELRTDKLVAELEAIDYQKLINHLGNDLGEIAVEVYPQLKELKAKLNRLTDKAIISGSGPTLLGLVSSSEQAKIVVDRLRQELSADYRIVAARTIDSGLQAEIIDS